MNLRSSVRLYALSSLAIFAQIASSKAAPQVSVQQSTSSPPSSVSPLPSTSNVSTGSTAAPTTSSPSPVSSSTASSFPQWVNHGKVGYLLTNRPFDSSFGASSFKSSSCTNFFTSVTNNITFQTCHSFPLLLKTSDAFFQDLRSNADALPSIMDTICSQNCSAIMQDYAEQIESACASDISAQTEIVIDARSGFREYNMMTAAGCLQRSGSSTPAQSGNGTASLTSSNYCFLSALANSSLPNSQADYNLYFIPFGTGLPSGSRPSCSDCNAELMATYAQYGSLDGTIPLAQTFNSAKDLVNIACGPSFISASETVAAASGPAVTSTTSLANRTAISFMSFVVLALMSWILIGA